MQSHILRNPVAVVLALAATVVAVGVIALVLLAVDHSQAGTSQAGGPNGAMAVDCDASQSGVQSDCTYPEGSTFQVEVHVTAAPAGGYGQFQAKLGWTKGVVNYLPTEAASGEALWSNCTIAARIDNWEDVGAPSVFFGCATFPPLTEGDTFTGAVLTFEFQCKTEFSPPDGMSPPNGLSPPNGVGDGQSVLNLFSSMNEPDPVQGGTIFTNILLQEINPDLSGASVTCGEPPPPPPMSPTATLTPPATIEPTATTLPGTKIFTGNFAVTDPNCGGGTFSMTLTPDITGIVSLSVVGFSVSGSPNNLVTEFDPPVPIASDGTFSSSGPLPPPLDAILSTFEGTFNFAADPATVSGTLTIALVADPSVVLCAATFSGDQLPVSGPTPTAPPPQPTATPTPSHPCLPIGAGTSSAKAHDISLDVLRGAGKIRGAQVKRYTAVVKNHNLTGAENIQLCFTVVPVFGCPAPVIDVALPYDVTPGEPDNDFVDVNGDGVPDSVAVAVAPGVLPNRSARIRVTVIYSSCPPALGTQETPFDYIVQADACHQGDPAPKGFFGSACPGSNDAGQDPNQSNDAPIQKAVNDALR